MGFEVTIGERGISWTGYPFREASVYPNGAIRWSDVRDFDAGALPPEVRTKRGETLFIPGDNKALFTERATKAGVPEVIREDVWSYLLDPFLDTQHSPKWIENSSRRLRACGISERHTERIRRLFGPMTLAYNSLLWEWCHFGLYDLLRAVFVGQGLANSEVPQRRLYGWAMAIAERGRRMERPRESTGDDASAILYGELSDWPTKDRMAGILEQAGLRITLGRYAIRVEDCSHFVFEEYGGDLGPPRIDADAGSVEALNRDASRVSIALGRAGVRHRFELYDAKRFLCGYLHYDWPAPPETVSFLADASPDAPA